MDYTKYEMTKPWPVRTSYDSLNALREARNAWNAELNNLQQVQFKADALAELGLTGHPKADKAFDMAWEDGHSGGIGYVFERLDRYAELLLP